MKHFVKAIAVGFATITLGATVIITTPEVSTANIVYAKAEPASLQPGNYVVGTDIKSGRYTVTPQNGSGNFSTEPKKSLSGSLNEILGTDDPSYVPSVTANFRKGDKVKVEGIPTVQFTPVTTRNKTNTTVLNTGIWVVGKDIKKGKYEVTPASGQSGNFTIQPKAVLGDTTNEILGDDTSASEVPKVNVKLHKGDTIQIQGMSQVNFAKK
ncbi:hypothetical protein [Loigolactobacillus coryniformis]|uniref:Uncharacterized protein n=1 Tax=Loigolactobacillus coryniformis subsp. torquens DSM 20004 = KCTC 3535 TaxID=1423822 RepID=A0A2D1KMK1_9LACO|nr:hypothetical protein [Loigolactobacillus coryniformis]ATO43375.1 hypothetical protein LC20004_05400 [Loigolactobacillus coryniformis subsp. torquens DSM 20004 = KCTC 3535]KRK85482.1 hypothetical protein FC16_GL001436 [Loigolactobacillus coryniformis subsp. torquens DSM 20004 = KCTC 3535]